MKILIFGSRDINYLPIQVTTELERLINNPKKVEFIVGDNNGIDKVLHKDLSRLGAASRTTIYCVDYAKNNHFDFKVNALKTSDNEFEADMYKFRDRKMADDCDIAIVITNGESKSIKDKIALLNMRDKKVYTFMI